MATSPVTVRTATSADVDRIVDTLTTAFFNDPLWGPAFPEVERRAGQAAAFWRLFAVSALRYPWTLVTENVESAAIWLPPGGVELTEAETAGYDDFVIDLVGKPAAEQIFTISKAFETARPDGPYFYLSLLATHDAHRGAGLGLGLLRESLAQIDLLSQPAYLESCNPANLDRYRSVGFSPLAELTMPAGQVVTTMWRPAH